MHFGIIFLAALAFLFVLSKSSSRLVRLGSVASMRLFAVGCNVSLPLERLNQPMPASAAIGFAYPVATSNRRFVDQNGNVYLLKAMASWAMAQRCPDTAITNALESLKSLGFNAVTVAPFGVH